MSRLMFSVLMVLLLTHDCALVTADACAGRLITRAFAARHRVPFPGGVPCHLVTARGAPAPCPCLCVVAGRVPGDSGFERLDAIPELVEIAQQPGAPVPGGMVDGRERARVHARFQQRFRYA